jgi:ubiquinone biosynthesis protein UbiJ
MLLMIENVLNRGLPRSPRARELCQELAGVRLGVEVRGVTRIIVRSDGSVLHCTHEAAGPCDAEVSGGALSLLRLSGSAPDAVLRTGAVEIRGDVEIARKFQELARLLVPDPEEELSLLIGDVPAHGLGRLARGAMRWGRHAGATALENLAEYFGHERADLVPHAEAEAFGCDVERLREDLDRLEARIKQLNP